MSAALGAACRVMTLATPVRPVNVAGAKVAVTPTGSPEVEKETVPDERLTRVSAIGSVAL